MKIRYFMVPVKVTKYAAPTITFTDSRLTNPPAHKVDWNNENLVSKTYTTFDDGSGYPGPPFPGPPKAGDKLYLALSEGYCIAEKISTVGLVKRPEDLDGSVPLQGSWYGLRISDVKSLVLTLPTGKSLDLSNSPLALFESIHIDAEGKLSVLLTQAGKVALGLPGLDEYVGSLDGFRGGASPAAAGAGTTDKTKLKALLLALADVLD